MLPPTLLVIAAVYIIYFCLYVHLQFALNFSSRVILSYSCTSNCNWVTRINVANVGFIATNHWPHWNFTCLYVATLAISRFLFPVSCLHYAVLLICLGSGTDTNWLWLGKDHAWLEISVLVATKTAGHVPTSCQKYLFYVAINTAKKFGLLQILSVFYLQMRKRSHELRSPSCDVNMIWRDLK